MQMLSSVCKTDDIYMIIVGNKCDANFDLEFLEKQKEEFKSMKVELQPIEELMTSAKLGINIDKIFENIMEHYILQK